MISHWFGYLRQLSWVTRLTTAGHQKAVLLRKGAIPYVPHVPTHTGQLPSEPMLLELAAGCSSFYAGPCKSGGLASMSCMISGPLPKMMPYRPRGNVLQPLSGITPVLTSAQSRLWTLRILRFEDDKLGS